MQAPKRLLASLIRLVIAFLKSYLALFIFEVLTYGKQNQDVPFHVRELLTVLTQTIQVFSSLTISCANSLQSASISTSKRLQLRGRMCFMSAFGAQSGVILYGREIKQHGSKKKK